MRNNSDITTIAHGRLIPSQVLMNLLRDTSSPILVYISEQFGLRRLPGLSKEALIGRLLNNLTHDDLAILENDLIAARYGSLPVKTLLSIALSTQPGGRAGNPRMTDMPAENAVLIEGGTRRWVYTMHGHDVVVDLRQRTLACSCEYFKFSSRRHAICKHLGRALTLIPEVYAREALIDLLVSREFGGPDTPGWRFSSFRAA